MGVSAHLQACFAQGGPLGRSGYYGEEKTPIRLVQLLPQSHTDWAILTFCNFCTIHTHGWSLRMNHPTWIQCTIPIPFTLLTMNRLLTSVTIPEGRPPTHLAENQKRQSLLAVHRNANLTNTRKLLRNDGKTPMPKLRFYADTSNDILTKWHSSYLYL